MCSTFRLLQPWQADVHEESEEEEYHEVRCFGVELGLDKSCGKKEKVGLRV